MPKQIPVPNELSQPFWDAANEKRLVMQTCGICNRMQYPPEQKCAQCGSADRLVWRQVSGKGRIYNYSVMHDCRIRVLQADQPFNIVIVELDEDPGVKMYSHLPGTPVDEVPVGAPVRLIFEEVAPGRLVPEWQVVK